MAKGAPTIRWTCDRCGNTEDVTSTTERPAGWLVDSLLGFNTASGDLCPDCRHSFDDWWTEGRPPAQADALCEFCGEPITMVDVGTMETGPGVEFMQGDCPNHCAARRAGVPVVGS